MSGEQAPPKPGWYADPDQVATVRYWNGNAWTDQRAPATPTIPEDEKPFFTKGRVRGLIASIVVAVGILYFTGTLDHALYPLGLNFQKCGKNGFGSVYCGKELDEYRETVEQPIQNAQNEATTELERLKAGQEAERLFGP